MLENDRFEMQPPTPYSNSINNMSRTLDSNISLDADNALTTNEIYSTHSPESLVESITPNGLEDKPDSMFVKKLRQTVAIQKNELPVLRSHDDEEYISFDASSKTIQRQFKKTTSLFKSQFCSLSPDNRKVLDKFDRQVSKNRLDGVIVLVDDSPTILRVLCKRIGEFIQHDSSPAHNFVNWGKPSSKDTTEYQEMLHQTSGRWGIVLIPNGLFAVDVIKRCSSVRVVITDQQMDEHDGIPLLKNIKRIVLKEKRKPIGLALTTTLDLYTESSASNLASEIDTTKENTTVAALTLEDTVFLQRNNILYFKKPINFNALKPFLSGYGVGPESTELMETISSLRGNILI